MTAVALPSLISLSRLPLSVAFFLAFQRYSPEWVSVAGFLFILAALTDFFDGWLARRLNAVTAFGKWLDPLCDALLFVFVYLAFVRAHLMPPVLFALFLGRESLQYGLIRPLYVRRRLSPAAKPAGKVKTVVQIAGTVAVLVLVLLDLTGSLSWISTRHAATGILTALVGVSLLSLGWYVGPLVRRAGKQHSQLDGRKRPEPPT